MKWCSLVFFLGYFLTSYGQGKVTIRVVDGLSEQPLSNTRALNQTNSAQAITNSQGFLELPATEGDAIMLTAVDYDTGLVVVPKDSKFQARLTIIEEALEFEGGIETFYQQVGKMMRYPRSARSRRQQGLVLASFTIDRDGRMVDFGSISAQNISLYREVERVLSKLKGAWSPAYQGKRMILPVLFTIGRGKPSFKLNNEDILPGSRVLSEIIVTAYQEVR